MDTFDLASVFALRAILRDLERAVEPTLRTITPVPTCRSVAILSGAFDPPTAAHLHLAERALSDGYERVVFTLATRTVGKRRTGLTPEDRLFALRAMASRHLVVAAVSHGLYADQAEAAARAFPGSEIAFLVGSDKIFQIFDSRWYRDRDAALERLFAHARLVVAPRADHTRALREILTSPENANFADRVDILRLHPAVGDLSSTRVRGLLRAGAEPTGLVPHAVAGILETLRAYAPPLLIGNEEVDAYAMRRALIDMLWVARDGASDPDTVMGSALVQRMAAEHLPDLRHLMAIAIAPTPPGRALRALVRQPRLDPNVVTGVAAGA